MKVYGIKISEGARFWTLEPPNGSYGPVMLNRHKVKRDAGRWLQIN
nr:hypothetical protein [uncultured Allomuricauda sp.]